MRGLGTTGAKCKSGGQWLSGPRNSEAKAGYPEGQRRIAYPAGYFEKNSRVRRSARDVCTDMTIYDRYLIKRLVMGYAALIGVLCVFFVLLHYVEFIDDFMSKGATNRQVFFYYYPNYLPEIIRLISPLALFLAAVFLTARLADQLFISALLQSGVSLYRLFVPYLVVGIGIMVAMTGFNAYTVPMTQRNVVAFENEYFKKTSRDYERSNLLRQNDRSGILAVRYYDPENAIASRVSLQAFGANKRLIRRTDAYEMRWDDSLRVWRLQDVVHREFAADGSVLRRTYARVDTVLNLGPRDLSRSERDVEMLTVPAAREYLASLQRSGVDHVGRQWVAYYMKYAYPAANLVLIFVAFPFAVERRRRGQAVQLGLAVLVAFVYFATTKVIEPFGYTESIPPIAAAWGPHAIFLLFGGALFFVRARR